MIYFLKMLWQMLRTINAIFTLPQPIFYVVQTHTSLYSILRSHSHYANKHQSTYWLSLFLTNLSRAVETVVLQPDFELAIVAAPCTPINAIHQANVLTLVGHTKIF